MINSIIRLPQFLPNAQQRPIIPIPYMVDRVAVVSLRYLLDFAVYFAQTYEHPMITNRKPKRRSRSPSKKQSPRQRKGSVEPNFTANKFILLHLLLHEYYDVQHEISTTKPYTLNSNFRKYSPLVQLLTYLPYEPFRANIHFLTTFSSTITSSIIVFIRG